MQRSDHVHVFKTNWNAYINNTFSGVLLIQNPPVVLKILSGSLELFIHHLVSRTEMVQNEFMWRLKLYHCRIQQATVRIIKGKPYFIYHISYIIKREKSPLHNLERETNPKHHYNCCQDTHKPFHKKNGLGMHWPFTNLLQPS